MNNYKLIIFDWDGTLMDSIARIVSSMKSAALNCQLVVPTTKQVKDIIGLSLPTALKCLFPSATKEQLANMVEQYKYQYIDEDKTPAPLFDNALTLLKALSAESKLLAVATGKARQGLQNVFSTTQIGHFFHASRCADEALSKPNPQMILSLLDELNVKPEHAVMIGDSKLDMAMAQASGIDRIGVTMGVHDQVALSHYKPKAIVNSLSELQQLLLSTEV